MTTRTPLEIAVEALEEDLELFRSVGTSANVERVNAALAAIRSAPVETLADDAELLRAVSAAVLADWGLTALAPISRAANILRAIDAYRRQKREGGK